MPSMKDIKRRIKSIQSSEQITKAMKMVSAAKFQKSQLRLNKFIPYMEGYTDLMREMSDDIYPTLHPVFQSRKEDNILLVVVTSSRGLCGGFNSNILKKTVQYMQDNPNKKIRLITIGNKAARFFNKKYSDKVIKTFPDLADNPYIGTMLPILKTLYTSFISEESDRVRIIYNHFKSAMVQNPVIQDFLPIDYIEPTRAETVVFEYNPSFETLVTDIVQEYLKASLYSYLIESVTGEFGSRMTAMSAATDNASKMISELILEYNRARQAQITKEISEIVGGAEALKT